MTAHTPEDIERALNDPGLCTGCNASEADCTTSLRYGAVKCCPDCEHRESVLAAVAPGIASRALNDAADGIQNRITTRGWSNYDSGWDDAIRSVLADLRALAAEQETHHE